MTTFKLLRELIAFKGGGTPSKQVSEYWNGDIPWASVKDFTSTSLSKTQDFISQEGLRNSSANLIPKGHVIIPTRMSLGKAAINTIDLAINQDLRALVPKVPLDVRFLLHAVLSLKEEIVKKGSGATVKGITQDELYRLEIAFPPLDDQIRIAHLLGKVEGLIAQRKQHLQQLDDLLKSVFLEMFGDPVRNEKGWDIQSCEKVVLHISSGTSYGGEERAFLSPDEVGVLKISAVTKGTFDPAEFKVVNPAQIRKTLRFVKRGDFLFSRANTVELVAACCVVPQDYTKLFLPDKLWVLTFNPELVNPQFFNYLLKNQRYRDIVRGLASGGHDSMLNISMKKFMTLGIPCPPIDLQGQFARIVEKVEILKTNYQQNLSELEDLYGALSQQAFKGELDLSRVPLPDEQDQPVRGEHDEQQEQVDHLSLPVGAITPTEVINHLVQAVQPQRRSELLARWLRQYLTNTSPDASLRSAQLLEGAWQTLQETQLENDGETPALTLDDYDALKDLVFKKLASRELSQTFDGDSNRVGLQKQSADWGAW